MSNNYPIGTEYDPSAPWNQKEQPEKEIEVTVSVTLSKTMKVKVNDYIVWSVDEEGFPDIDYSMCDLKSAVKEQKYLPQDAYSIIINTIDSKKALDFKDWVVDDFEVELG